MAEEAVDLLALLGRHRQRRYVAVALLARESGHAPAAIVAATRRLGVYGALHTFGADRAITHVGYQPDGDAREDRFRLDPPMDAPLTRKRAGSKIILRESLLSMKSLK